MENDDLPIKSAAQPNPEIEARKTKIIQDKVKRIREQEQRKRQKEQEKKQKAQAAEVARNMRQDRQEADKQRSIDRSASADQKKQERRAGVTTRDAMRKNKSKTTAGKSFFGNRSASNLAINASTEINCIDDMVGLNEDMYFKVKIEGLPTMYVNSANREELRKDLVGLLRNPSKAVGDIKRVTPQEVKKRLRLRSQGKEEEEMNETYIKFDHPKLKFVSKGFIGRKEAERHNDHLVGKEKASHKSFVHKHKDNKFYVVDVPAPPSRFKKESSVTRSRISSEMDKASGRTQIDRKNDLAKAKAARKQSTKDLEKFRADNAELLKGSFVDEAKKTKPSFSRAYNRDKKRDQAELRRQHDQNVKSELGIKEEAQLDEDIRAMLINEGYSEEDIQYIIDEGLWDSIKSVAKSAADKIKKTTSNIRRKVMNPNKDSLLSKARTKLGLNVKPKPVVAKPKPVVAKPKPATTVVSSKPAPRKPTYHNNNRKDKIAKGSNTGGVVNRSSKNKSAHVPLSIVSKPKPAAPAPVATNKPTATSNISPAALAIAKKYAKTEDVMTSTSADSQVKLNPESGKYEKKRMKRGQINAQTATESVMSKLKNYYMKESSAYHTKKAAAMGMGPTDEACWSKYKQVGMKKKGEKMVPNCVPKNK